MTINKETIERYQQEHPHKKKGKYKFKCAYRSNESEFKCIYYIIDDTLRTAEIFVDINITDEIDVKFSEKISQDEKDCIIDNILDLILLREQYPSLLHYSLYSQYIESSDRETFSLLPMDYMDILGYIKYHQGISQKTIDLFYDIFMPAINRLKDDKKYKNYLASIVLLFNTINYTYEWNSSHTNYLDSEYQYHLYYLRVILKDFYSLIDDFYEAASDETFMIIENLCLNPRFALFIMVDYIKNLLKPSENQDALYQMLKNKYHFSDDKEDKNYNLIYAYFSAIYRQNHEKYRITVKEILREVIKVGITYVNYDLDLALGNAFLKSEGHELLIDIFEEDYNTFLFNVFTIESLPEELKNEVREKLCQAVVFFAGRMDNEKFRMSSLEQITNINRLLLDNYRGWYQ